jgi:hypothetical protein
MCSWAFPEAYKPIIISDANKESIKRVAETKSVYQSDLASKYWRNSLFGILAPKTPQIPPNPYCNPTPLYLQSRPFKWVKVWFLPI